MELDFMDRLRDKINTLGLYARCEIGLLGTSESLSIMAMPGGSETAYFDGSREKDYQVQVNAKSKNQMYCFNALTQIYQALENLDQLPSENGSYAFQSISTPSLPSILERDEQGYWVYVMSISAKITIYHGVKM